MVAPPVIVAVPEKTPTSPSPPPPLPPGQNGPAITPPPQQTAAKIPPPPPKQKRKPKKKNETQTASTQAPEAAPAQQPATAPATQAQTAASVPQLSQVLSDDQRRDFEAHIRDSLDSANRNLSFIGNRQLSAQQQTLRSQAQSFITQAQELRKTDLVTARSLAERADLLSKDLRDSLQ